MPSTIIAHCCEPLECRRLLADASALGLLADGDQPGAGAWDEAPLFGVHRIYGGSIEGVIGTPDDVDLFRFGPFAGSMGDTFGAKLIPTGDLQMFVKVYSSPGNLLYDYGPATADRPLAVPFSLLDGNHFVEVSSDGVTAGSYRIDIFAGLGVYDFDASYFGAVSSGFFTGPAISARGFIQYQGDVNVHWFRNGTDGPVRFRIIADDGATLDPHIRVFTVSDGQMNVLGEGTEVVMPPPTSTEERAYVEVTDAAGTGIGDYTIEMVNVPPANHPPAIGSFTVTPATAEHGQSLLLAATGITDADGDPIQRVLFIRDANDNGLYDSGELDDWIGEDNDPAGGWTLSLNAGSLPAGTHRFFAFAFDGKDWSERATATATVLAAPGGAEVFLQFTSPAGAVQVDRGDVVNITWNDPNLAGTTIQIFATLSVNETVTLDWPAFRIASIPGDAANSFAWDTSAVAPGTYSILGRAFRNDFTNMVMAVATGSITIRHDGSHVRGDFDGDGRADLIAQDPQTRQTSVWIMDGVKRRTEVPLPTIADGGWRVVGSGDFDGDGDSDILWQHAVDNRICAWLMDGLAVVGFKGMAYSPNLNWKVAAIEDFDADGKPDLVWTNRATGATSFWLMDGTAIKGFKGGPQLRDLDWQLSAAGDFDGDGQADLVWKHATSMAGTFWLMDGTAIRQFAALPLAPFYDGILAAADYDGDGDDDLLTYRGTHLDVWLLDGTTAPDRLLSLTPLRADLRLRR